MNYRKKSIGFVVGSIIGFVLSLLVFFWAISNRQYLLLAVLLAVLLALNYLVISRGKK